MKGRRIEDYLSHFADLLKDPYFIKYVLKCIIGTSVCYALYRLFPEHQLNWSIISVLLVLAPDHADSVKLALDRISANIIGAGIGLCAFLVYPPNIVVLVSAVVVTVLFCYFIRLGAPSRSALAALIIVLIQETESNTWFAALERLICVLIGCAVGLILTFIFVGKESDKNPPETPEDVPNE